MNFKELLPILETFIQIYLDDYTPEDNVTYIHNPCHDTWHPKGYANYRHFYIQTKVVPRCLLQRAKLLIEFLSFENLYERYTYDLFNNKLTLDTEAPKCMLRKLSCNTLQLNDSVSVENHILTILSIIKTLPLYHYIPDGKLIPFFNHINLILQHYRWPDISFEDLLDLVHENLDVLEKFISEIPK